MKVYKEGNTYKAIKGDTTRYYFKTYEYTTAGTYEIILPISDYYKVEIVAGGGHYTAFPTGDWDGGYAYSRGYGGGSGSAWVGEVYLQAGTYTGIVGGTDAGSTLKIEDTNIISTYQGGTNTGYTYYGGAGGSAPTINSNYNTRNVTLNSAGNPGDSHAGDWNTGWANGGSSLLGGYGSGQSGRNNDGYRGGNTIGYLKISFKTTTEIPDYDYYVDTSKFYAFDV